MHQLAHLFLEQGEGHLDPKDLEPARGGAGAGAECQQDDEDNGGERAPGAEVAESETRGGKHGDDIEAADAQGIHEAVDVSHPEIEGDDQGHPDDQPEEALHLGILEQAVVTAGESLHIEQEGQAAEEHEEGAYPVRRVGEVGHGLIGGGVAAGAEGRHGVVDRFEQVHATHPVGEEAEHGEYQIDQHYVVGHRFGAGGALVGPIRALGLEQLHAPDVEVGQYRHRHHDEADSAQPLQDGSPQQDAVGHAVEPRQHGGSRGGDPRHGLEVGVGKVDMGDEDEGQGPEDAGDHPDRGGEQEHLPHAEVKLCLATVMEAEQGGTVGDQDRLEKFDETFRTGQQGQQGGQPHEERQLGEHQPEREDDGMQLDHAR